MSLILKAYRILALLEGGLILVSASLGNIGFLFTSLKSFNFLLASGKYLDVFCDSE